MVIVIVIAIIISVVIFVAIAIIIIIIDIIIVTITHDLRIWSLVIINRMTISLSFQFTECSIIQCNVSGFECTYHVFTATFKFTLKS